LLSYEDLCRQAISKSHPERPLPPSDCAEEQRDRASVERAFCCLSPYFALSVAATAAALRFQKGQQVGINGIGLGRRHAVRRGSNYPRLKTIKQKYDPTGLFFVHHGVGTENWSPDGFTRTANATDKDSGWARIYAKKAGESALGFNLDDQENPERSSSLDPLRMRFAIGTERRCFI
jgi:hypothetical protein